MQRIRIAIFAKDLSEEDFRCNVITALRLPRHPGIRRHRHGGAPRRRSKRLISHFDCQIAAIARAHAAAVATRNTGNYEGCGIAVSDPRQKTGIG